MADDEKELTFWEHLEELLNRLRTALYALVFSTLVVMAFPITLDFGKLFSENPWYPTVASLVIDKIRTDFVPPDVELMPISWYAPLEVYVYISLVLGAILSLPLIAYNLHKFIDPALHEKEKKAVTPFVVSFTGLFLFGVLIGYMLVMPATIRILLLTAQPFGLAPRYEFAQFFSLVAGGLFVCGFVMTFPVFLVLFVKVGLLETKQLKANRKYIYGGIMITISILDPDPTLVTETFLGIPVIIALEVAIRLASRYEKKSPK
jgi:sec-independent protein translocase protein TatC